MRLILCLLGTLLVAADYGTEGIKALEAQRYPEAIAAFEKAVAAAPDDFSAHFHLALAHSLAGQNAQAIPGFRKALELKPGLYEAELNLGVVLIATGAAKDAIPLLESAKKTKPSEMRPLYYLGEALLESARFPEAQASFQAALAIDPKSVPARAGLGRSLLRQGQLRESEAELRQAGDAGGLLELAAAYEKQRDHAAAIAIYSAAPSTPAIDERLGLLLLETGKPQEAAERLESAVKQSPTTANRHALATAYLRAGQAGRAAAIVDQAIAAEPASVELRLQRAGLLRDQKLFAEAAQEFFRVTQLRADSRPAWMGLATMLLSLENYPKAIAAFDRLEALGNPEPGIYFLRALAYDKSKLYELARDNYRRFLSLSQDKHPDEEFKARQRIKVIDKELNRR